MNSRYSRKKLTKLLNPTNSLYNFNNNSSETEKSGVKIIYWEAKHIGRWSRGWTSPMRQGTKDKLAHEHARELASHADTWVHKHARHADTRGTLALKALWHVSMRAFKARCAWACKHARQVGVRAHKHVKTCPQLI